MARSVRISAAVLLCALLLIGCAPTVRDLYGTWYADAGDIRNIIQFYDSDGAKNAFIWVVYDIASDERTSVQSGTYDLDENTVTFTYSGGSVVTLEYEKDGDTLTLTLDGTAVEFQLYTLPEGEN